GIRDDLVTGVQTCALPIYRLLRSRAQGDDRSLSRHPSRCRRAETAGDLPRGEQADGRAARLAKRDEPRGGEGDGIKPDVGSCARSEERRVGRGGGVRWGGG